MRHICTYFDHRYLVYGLALYRSLARHASEPFTLHILCLDDMVYARLDELALPGARLIRLAELERAYPALLEARENRSLAEYYFTLTPALPAYVMANTPGVELVAYADADLYFYSSLDPVYQELGDGSIFLVPHRCPAEHEVGTYNVGLVVFRNDPAGRCCLERWRERCIQWCYDRYEDGKCADQGYLEDWPRQFSGVVVSRHKGIGLAPWNVGLYRVSGANGAVLVDSLPLVFYHFGNVRMTRPWLFTHDLPAYKARMTSPVRRLVYAPYIRELQRAAREAGGAPERPLQSAKFSWADSLRHEAFRSRMVVIGSRMFDVNIGPVAAALGRIRRMMYR